MEHVAPGKLQGGGNWLQHPGRGVRIPGGTFLKSKEKHWGPFPGREAQELHGRLPGGAEGSTWPTLKDVKAEAALWLPEGGFDPRPQCRCVLTFPRKTSDRELGRGGFRRSDLRCHRS